MPILYIIAFAFSLFFSGMVFFGFIVLPSCIAGTCLAGTVATFSGPHQPFYSDDVHRARLMTIGTAPIPPERALVERVEQPALPAAKEVEHPHLAD